MAQRLVSHGVDVVLDKWDLKEGQDKYAFMERCVNDTEITKVLIVCDKVYAQKANDRTGGVGDETVIISSEIYGNTLTSLNYDVEVFLRENARNTAKHNRDIAGVGVMF